MSAKKIFPLVLAVTLLSCIPVYAKPETDENVDNAIVKKVYETVQDKLLDPDSIIVYDCYACYAQTYDTSYQEYLYEEFGRTLDEKNYDLYTVYLYIGATNRMGGISDEQYVYITDVYGNIIDGCSGTKYDEIIDSDDTDELTYELLEQWVNIRFNNIIDTWGDSWTDYKDYLKSDEFEELDYEEILANLPEDYEVTEPISKEETELYDDTEAYKAEDETDVTGIYGVEYFDESFKVSATVGVNMRDKPAIDGEIIKTIPAETIVTVIGYTERWYLVEYDGLTGYVKKDSYTEDK
ncbi:MAG: SH3 domain-containing protein [Lachnospiraceae bacterium]|nr:SH3 domain-containing protein [Lachnospiraceae bacterium]